MEPYKSKQVCPKSQLHWQSPCMSRRLHWPATASRPSIHHPTPKVTSHPFHWFLVLDVPILKADQLAPLSPARFTLLSTRYLFQHMKEIQGSPFDPTTLVGKETSPSTFVVKHPTILKQKVILDSNLLVLVCHGPHL